MRAKDYIVNNKSSIQHLAEIERVIEELSPLRHKNGGTDNEIGTKDYYESYLTPDSTGHKPLIQNKHKTIQRNIAVSFRSELLRVVADDKSFGYIYYLLQSVQNRFLAFPVDCIPNRIIIEEAIAFCWEDLIEQIEPLKGISEKILYVEDKKTLWEQNDNYKNLQRNITSFGEKCQSEIKKLERRLQLQPKEVDLIKIKHNLPTIEIKRYSTDKIYNSFFKGFFAVCNPDCFNNWLVKGYEDEPITFLLKGRGGAFAKAQLISFIVKITGDAGLETKLSYYTKVFGKEADVKGSTSSGLNSKLSNLLKKCEI